MYIVVKICENSGSYCFCLNSKLFIKLSIIFDRAHQKPELDDGLQEHVQEQFFCNPIC